MLRLAVIGRTEILYNTILLLRSHGFEISLIITSKEAPEYKIHTDDFKRLANEIDAYFISTSDINSQTAIDLIKKCGSLDLGISLNYSGIISQQIIDFFRIGILNAHGGDLPKYRGNACQAWAIINGEEKLGLCVHKMIGGELDSGDIICREYFPLNQRTKVTDCWNWMSDRIPNLFLYAANLLIVDPKYTLEVQSKNEEDALRCYPRLPEDGRISWKMSSLNILRLINASNKPYAGAYCFLNGKELIIWDADIIFTSGKYCAVEGQVCNIHEDGSVSVICGEGILKLLNVEYNGKIGDPGEWIKSIRTRLR